MNNGTPFSVHENDWKLRFLTLIVDTANQQHSQPVDQVFSIERKESPSLKELLECYLSSTGTQEKISDQVRQEEFPYSAFMTSHVSARIPPHAIFFFFFVYLFFGHHLKF